ncbi:MAG: hypothetical protein KDK10_17165 [Maritimibacter sp.]|nr:hypothetical protein [Maritimibacter sp.]
MRSDRLAARLLGLAVAAFAAPAGAEQFTTAAEVKPMLDVTRANWVALREYDGKDQLLFTQILAWRCGIERIDYAVNDGKKTRLKVEPCHEGETRPNDIKATDIPPYVTFPVGSVKSVTVWLEYDDGSADKQDYKRKKILSR